MAGIYIHIPFCKQACSYCDFHFSTKLINKSAVLDAILKELELRKEYLSANELVQSIYFGGGSPSLLTSDELEKLIGAIKQNFNLSSDIELTLEANPDDLSKEKLLALKVAGINRLSVGVQSFHQKDLEFMNRAHNSEQAITCIKRAQDIGFENISLDLIFGSPTTSLNMWEENLETFFSLNVPHLSAYSLTVETGTKLEHDIRKKRTTPLNDDKGFEQYEFLQKSLKSNCFEQYEVSNYCKNNKIAKHNTAYWFGKNYLGVGPSAHSYNGCSRQWNVSNNSKYVNALKNKLPFFEQEHLSEQNRYNEYLITRLRTKWGVLFNEIESNFPKGIRDHFYSEKGKIPKHLIIENKTSLRIHPNVLFRSDSVVVGLLL